MGPGVNSCYRAKALLVRMINAHDFLTVIAEKVVFPWPAQVQGMVQLLRDTACR